MFLVVLGIDQAFFYSEKYQYVVEPPIVQANKLLFRLNHLQHAQIIYCALCGWCHSTFVMVNLLVYTWIIIKHPITQFILNLI